MINGVSVGMMGEHLSGNINAAWADSPWQFLKLMLLAMSSSWYLYALALFFVFARLFRQQKPLIMLLAVGLNYAAVTGIIPGWGPESLSQYFVFFLFGAFYSEILIRWSEWRRDNLLPWTLLLLLTIAHSLLGLERSLFLCVLAILGSIALCRALNRMFSMHWLNWVGKNTLQIYVLHRIFIEFFGLSAILYAVGHQLFASQAFSLLWAVGFPPLMVLLCVGCSVGVWTLLNRGWGQSLFIYPKLLRMKFEG